ncbi:hypothetical protein RUND412_004210 [Rhizina undulata]
MHNDHIVAPSFSGVLQNPIITLCVGQSQPEVVYKVHEEQLIKIDYFRSLIASYSGGDISQVPIRLPEDEPYTMAKLIEYLYTGDYKCTRNLPASHSRSKELSEKLVHINVFLLAQKYNVRGLDTLSSHKLWCVASLQLQESLILWATIYRRTERGCRLRLDGGNYEGSKEKARLWAKEVTRIYPEEVRRLFQECPDFAFDIVEMLASTAPTAMIA